MRAIAIFAHNEEKNIIACLQSVKKIMKPDDKCFVLNNGSTDKTGLIVEDFSKSNTFCNLVTIDMGDKSNAWNFFVHELGIQAEIFYFIDGDCEVRGDSLNSLEECIKLNPDANVAAAIPLEECSVKIRETMLKEGGLAGALYAIPRHFVERLRASNVRLPIGYIGDDSLIGALAYWDLEPRGTWDIKKIIVCKDAEYFYRRLSVFSVADMRLYYRRKIRYSLRHFQIQLLKKSLKDIGLAAIPDTVNGIYAKNSSELQLKWRGLDTLFDYLALRIIKNSLVA